MPYLIRHKDGREYEIERLADFHKIHEPQGFKIVANAPAVYDAPPKAAAPKAAPAKARTTTKAATAPHEETPVAPVASGDGRAS